MTRTIATARPFLGLLAIALLAACTAGQGSLPSGTTASAGATPTGSAPMPNPSDSPVPSAAPPSGSPGKELISQPPLASATTGEVPADVMAGVRAELATLVGPAAAARATVEVARAVTWPDGSLGCPRPGVSYTQALVPGYQVVLALDASRYDYRVGTHGAPVLCQPRFPHLPSASPAP